MKKIFASLLSFAIILSISVPAFAAESPSAPSSPSVNSGNVTILNDPALIQKADATIQEDVQINAARFGLTLKNRTTAGQFHYGDDPFLADSIQGPMSTGPKLDFETTAKAGFNGDCGVTKGMISASFGVDFSYSEKVTRSYQFDPIPARKWLVYRCYVNYNVYEFDVYSGSQYLGISKYWTPVGIVVEHELV